MFMFACARRLSKKDSDFFGLIFFLMFLPFAIILWILKNKKMNGTAKLISISIVVIFMLVVAVSSSDNNAVSTVSQPQSTSAQSQRAAIETGTLAPSSTPEKNALHPQKARHIPALTASPASEPTMVPNVQIQTLVFLEEKSPSIMAKNQTYKLLMRYWPKDAAVSDIIFSVDNSASAEIKEVSVDSSAVYPTIEITLETKDSGLCQLTATAKYQPEVQDTFVFEVKAQAIQNISSHLEFLPNYEVGDKTTLKFELEPANLSETDFTIVSACEDIVSISNLSLSSSETSTIVEFSMEAHAAGDTYLVLTSADGLKRNEYKVHVIPKDDSRIVWITPTGKRYHFSEKDAGKNAIQVTQNQAEERGYTPCKTCSDDE